MALEEDSLEPHAALSRDDTNFPTHPDPVFVTPKPLIGLGGNAETEARTLPPELVDYILPKRGASPDEREAYHDLYKKLLQTFRPGDVVEQVEIARIACLMWDCSTLTRYLNSLLLDARDGSLKALLQGRVENADAIAAAVRRGEPDAIKTARDILTRFGLTDEDVHARSFISNIEIIDRLKRMELSATREFTRLLKDLDYRKMVREAARLRELRESLSYQHFRKYGFDMTMRVPR